MVERSGQSLRSFYQYFAGKHELLLALFEESVRSTAEHLKQVVDEVDDPLERLHRFVVEHYLVCRPTPRSRQAKKSGPTPAAMAEFGQRLLTEHPKEASRAFEPVVSLLERLLDDAAAAGAIRSGLSTTGRWPASPCRRSCSTPSPPRSAAPRSAPTATKRPSSCGSCSSTASVLTAQPDPAGPSAAPEERYRP